MAGSAEQNWEEDEVNLVLEVPLSPVRSLCCLGDPVLSKTWSKAQESGWNSLNRSVNGILWKDWI